MIAPLKPKSPFLPVFSLCDGLEEKDGLIFTHELLGIGDPEGILLHMFNTCKLGSFPLSFRFHMEQGTSCVVQLGRN